jgi:hypothetical protein
MAINHASLNQRHAKFLSIRGYQAQREYCTILPFMDLNEICKQPNNCIIVLPSLLQYLRIIQKKLKVKKATRWQKNRTNKNVCALIVTYIRQLRERN